MAMAPRYFEDFTVGFRFRSFGDITITAERIKSFAAEFDPQPSHLGDNAGHDALLDGLVASGWHTAAVAMRLIVNSDLGLDGRAAGAGVESMRWLVPVRAGDSLRVEGTVTKTRPSRSHADRGVLKFHITAYNQQGEAVLEGTHVVLVPRRGVSPPTVG
jgi:acyl dehydratase